MMKSCQLCVDVTNSILSISLASVEFDYFPLQEKINIPGWLAFQSENLIIQMIFSPNHDDDVAQVLSG